jgi:hypothetical protein
VVFLIIPAGSGKRAHNFAVAYSLSNAGVSAFLYTLRTVYRIFSMPFVWVTIVIAWVAGQYAITDVKRTILRSGIKPYHALLFCIMVAFLFYFIINFLSGELLPPRANNLMAFYVLTFVLVAAFLAGILYAGPMFSGEMKKLAAISGTGLLIIFFTSPLFFTSIENVFTGYIYNEIMNEREVAIKTALQSGKNSVVILPYETDFKKQAERTGNFTRKFIDKLDKYPRLIYYFDPVADTSFYIHYYAAYKNIDTIEFQGSKFRKMGFSKEAR